MFKFNKHLNGKTTYIMGNWCLNDYQLFHKEDAQNIFDEYNVSKQHQDDIMNSFYDELTNDDKIISDNIDIITIQIVNQIIFDEYIKHGNDYIRCVVAKFGTNEMRKQLIEDPDWQVRVVVARHGTDDMKQQLISDPEWAVRQAVAEFGTDEMRLQLINDHNEYVRMSLVKHGNNNIRQQLVNDPNTFICDIALYYLNKDKQNND